MDELINEVKTHFTLKIFTVKKYLQNYRENFAVILKVKNLFQGNLTRILR